MNFSFSAEAKTGAESTCFLSACRQHVSESAKNKSEIKQRSECAVLFMHCHTGKRH